MRPVLRIQTPNKPPINSHHLLRGIRTRKAEPDMGYLIMLYNRFHYSVISVMLPIRNGSSFSLLQQRLRGLIVCNFATKIRFLSEKAKSFSIFLQITEVLQMEIGAQKKEMKQNLRCFISFYIISYSVSYCIS